MAPARAPASRSREPFVSVVLTTRDRPQLLAIALACYRHQTYRHRELIVVDDGPRYPADRAAVEALGGSLIRLDTDNPLGTKLNLGVGAARGSLCAKMDDDDWYAPTYLETMIGAVLGRSSQVCRPTIAFTSQFLFFDVAEWTVRLPGSGSVPGATLVFAREDWEARPFRRVTHHEDMWFLRDLMDLGVSPLPVLVPDIFMAVRHAGSRRERGHTWNHHWLGKDLEAHLRECPVYRSPEALLPGWAVQAYRELQSELVAGGVPQRDLW